MNTGPVTASAASNALDLRHAIDVALLNLDPMTAHREVVHAERPSPVALDPMTLGV
jgi:hypothetical protein